MNEENKMAAGLGVVNDRPIEHQTRKLTFTCARADLRAPIKVHGYLTLRFPLIQNLASEVAQFAAWHALNIFPELNGFQGYDTLTFEMVSLSEPSCAPGRHPHG